MSDPASRLNAALEGRYAAAPRLGPVFAAMLLAAAGCGGTSDSPTGPGQGLADILSPGSETLLIGETVLFTVTAANSDGDSLSATDLTWTSSDPSVATVEIGDSVSVLGVGEGVATITATIEDRSGTAQVTVSALDLASVDPGTFLTC